MTLPILASRPAHVPEHLVVPFDLYAVPGAMHDIVGGHLAGKVENRRGHPGTDLFIRCFHVSSSTREVRGDMEFNGIVMRRGEMVQTLPLVYGYDESRFDNPFRIDLRRKFPIVHAAFGKGTHLCPGTHLARQEIQIFLEEWLTRIPEFRLKPGTEPAYATGVVNAAVSLHLQW